MITGSSSAITWKFILVKTCFLFRPGQEKALKNLNFFGRIAETGRLNSDNEIITNVRHYEALIQLLKALSVSGPVLEK
jgi:hypothetical protein